MQDIRRTARKRNKLYTIGTKGQTRQSRYIPTKIQRKGLAQCLGLPLTSSREALEVELGVMPLKHRRTELSIREGARILRKRDNQLIKRKWLEWSIDPENEKIISPVGELQMQLRDMQEATKVTLHNIEHEFTCCESLYLSRKRPEYWDGLGSSKSRTIDQQDSARELIGNMLNEVDTDTMVAFTDGSCQPNPGPCGAVCCLFLPNQQDPIKLTKPVSIIGTILLGELVAILMTLQYILMNIRNTPALKRCLLLSDSQSAVGVLTLGWECTSYRQTVVDTISAIKQLGNKEVQTDIRWTPGHAYIRGNEIADSLAKEAATQAVELDPAVAVVTLDCVKKAAHQTCLIKWQRDWELSERGRHLFSIKPNVGEKPVWDHPDITSSRAISELRLGYARLKDYLYKVGLSGTNKCLCGETETVEYFLIHCEQYTEAREKLRREIWVQTGSFDLSLGSILGKSVAGSQDTPELDHKVKFEMLARFVGNTKRFC